MNTDTGAIYRGEDAIAAAQLRGEPLAFVSERVAQMVEAGRSVLSKRERSRRKARLKMAKHSRRRNR